MSAMTLAVRAEGADTAQFEADAVRRDLLATLHPIGAIGRVWIGSLVAIVGLAAAAWIYQLVNGLRVTDMRNYVSWGTYMTDFVFFIGISHAGTLISAILRVTNAGWRRPITRMAEAITVFALLVGGSMVVIDMGRPDRVLNLVLHGRVQSPILWDLISVATYITGSLLYLYVAMIPDMPILAEAARAAGRSPRLVRLYEVLSLGFRETPEHRRRLARALGAMAVIIIPVAVSVHSVVSWVFGMTLRPGWHSTIFAPYFVIGAIYSGTAAIITAMALFRRAYHLEQYLLPEHFRRLAMLLLALTMLYGYFTLSEFLTTWYGRTATDVRLLDLLGGGAGFGLVFWGWTVVGFFAPLALLVFPSRRSLASILTASVLINVGMWLERYLIIIPTLETPFLPASAAGIKPHYFPSIIEITITAGAFAAFMLLFTLFSRVFPILSIWETAEAAEEASPAPAYPERRHRMAPATIGVLLLFGALPSVATAHRASGQVTPAGAAAPVARPGNTQIALKRASEDGQDMLVATVTADGRPLAGVTVGFSVARTFGNMTLGTDQTLSDGSAAVAFPKGVPGDSIGRLRVLATVQAPAELVGTNATVTMSGGLPTRVTNESQPRALWSARPPLAMIATILGLLLCVWSTYAFVVGQLIAMSHVKQEG